MERIAVHHEGESPSIIPRLPVHFRETEQGTERFKNPSDIMIRSPSFRGQKQGKESDVNAYRGESVSEEDAWTLSGNRRSSRAAMQPRRPISPRSRKIRFDVNSPAIW